jgi:hypothetical protein
MSDRRVMARKAQHPAARPSAGVRATPAVLALATPTPAGMVSAEAVARLQRTVGNRAVARLLEGRRPPPLESRRVRRGALARPVALRDEEVAPKEDKDKKQWEDDWNDPAFAAAQRYFKGEGRPKGTPKERYLVLCPLYKAQGISRPLKYVSDNIVSASFFGHGTPAHKDLKAALATAEASLKALKNPDGSLKYPSSPFKKVWAFNARTTSAGGWSNHADGQAVDIDPDENPHLTSAAHRSVITALTGIDIAAANPGAATGKDAYDAAKEASEAFKANYNVAGMEKRIQELKDQEAKFAVEKAAVEAELKAVPTGKKASKDDRKKAAELKAKVKAISKSAKPSTTQRQTLERELKRYKDLDAAIAKLEGSASEQEKAVSDLEAQIAAETDTKKKRALQGALKTKQAALKKTQKALAEKKADTLRGYGKTGILNLPKDVVEAMKTAGIKWGGDWAKAKDFMHFSLTGK